jgi:hypothetical protein
MYLSDPSFRSCSFRWAEAILLSICCANKLEDQIWDRELGEAGRVDLSSASSSVETGKVVLSYLNYGGLRVMCAT